MSAMSLIILVAKVHGKQKVVNTIVLCDLCYFVIFLKAGNLIFSCSRVLEVKMYLVVHYVIVPELLLSDPEASNGLFRSQGK